MAVFLYIAGQRKTAGENSCGFYFLSCIGIKLPYNYVLFFSEAIFSTSSMVSSVYAVDGNFRWQYKDLVACL